MEFIYSNYKGDYIEMAPVLALLVVTNLPFVSTPYSNYKKSPLPTTSAVQAHIRPTLYPLHSPETH